MEFSLVVFLVFFPLVSRIFEVTAILPFIHSFMYILISFRYVSIVFFFLVRRMEFSFLVCQSSFASSQEFCFIWVYVHCFLYCSLSSVSFETPIYFPAINFFPSLLPWLSFLIIFPSYPFPSLYHLLFSFLQFIKYFLVLIFFCFYLCLFLDMNKLSNICFSISFIFFLLVFEGTVHALFSSSFPAAFINLAWQ